jgi:hypothetical protein
MIGGLSYKGLGYDGLGMKPIVNTKVYSPQETRNTIQSWAITSSSMYIGSENDVVKADKNGLYVGNSSYDDAPFKVNMDGEATLTNVNITAKESVIQPLEDGVSIFRVNSADGTQIFDIDTTNGWVNIGPDQPLYEQDPQTSLYVVRDIDGYHSINVINTSNGEFASSDMGAVNNNPDAGSGYVDLGINGMGWADPDYAVFDAEAGYVFCADNNFYVGAGGADASIYFFVGGFDSKDYIKAEINSEGVFFPVQAATASAPTYVEGGIYYDTTAHKLMVGGAAGWETVTSSA